MGVPAHDHERPSSRQRHRARHPSSQMHRLARGVLRHDKRKTHSSGKLFVGRPRVIPYRGSGSISVPTPRTSCCARIAAAARFGTSLMIRARSRRATNLLDVLQEISTSAPRMSGACRRCHPFRVLQHHQRPGRADIVKLCWRPARATVARRAPASGKGPQALRLSGRGPGRNYLAEDLSIPKPVRIYAEAERKSTRNC